MITEKEKRLIKKIIKKYLPEEKKKRGRKGKLKKHDRVFLLVLKRIEALSVRNLRKRGTDFYDDLPHFTVIFRQIREIDEKEINLIMRLLSNEIENLLKRKVNKDKNIYIIADGTGFGYNRPYYLRTERGADIKKISSHVKVVVVIGVIGKKRYIKGISVGDAYSDERVLLKRMLKEVRIEIEKRKSNIFIGDKLYGMDNELLEELDKRFDKVIVKVEDGLHNKVRSEIRKRIKLIYEGNKEIYKKKRFNIEGFIGNVKNRYGSYEEAKTYESAKSMVLGKFLAYLISEYIKLVGYGKKMGKEKNFFLFFIFTKFYFNKIQV